jgi:type IV pilus assembly protein PilP
MLIRLLSIFLCSLFLCSYLVACDDVTPAPATSTSTANKPSAQSVKTDIAEEEEVKEEIYVYNPIDTRDPFKNPFSIIVEIPVADAIPLTPLQKIGLDQLRLIGIIIGKGAPRAMVIGPDDKSFILQKGIKIGRNNGVVAQITTEAVFVEEQYLDFVGETKNRIKKIKLPKREE